MCWKHGVSSKTRARRVHDAKLPTKDEWQCGACENRWRVLKETEPSKCMDLAVDRNGKRRGAKGCGSENIFRSSHAVRDTPSPLSAVVSGDFGLVSGKQIRVAIDPDMGENEGEYEWGDRELRINQNHPAFRVAERLDDMSRRSASSNGEIWPAQTVHLAKCVCMAWGELHCEETQRWPDFRHQYEQLLADWTGSF